MKTPKALLLLLATLVAVCTPHLIPVDLPLWKIPPPQLAPAGLYEEARQAVLAGRAIEDQVFTYTFIDSSSSKTLTADIQNAVRFAGKVISHALNKTGTATDIRAQVTYKELPSSGGGFVLGGAAPAANCLDSGSGLYWPSSLWRFVKGGVACTATQDIIVELTDQVTFYTGLDGNVPADEFDLVTIVLHELIHAMGFQSLLRPCSGSSCSYQGASNNLFDNTLQHGASPFSPASATGAERYAFATSNNGFQISPPILQNGSSPAALYLPSTFQSGSSVAHLALSFQGTPNALMTPTLGRGEVRHSLGGIVWALLKGFGYPMNECNTRSDCASCIDDIYCEWCHYDATCGSSQYSPYVGACSVSPGFLANSAFCGGNGSTVASATTTAGTTTGGGGGGGSTSPASSLHSLVWF